ncbi:hypothetical protein AVEN_237892-1 [Araneus ventricosus]|uniref:Tc1-like transposase DDE domain-containing protein n=1 Tax=Araneus ventricosus TaxID=182803 RepID=A0A4Y2PRG7_ARAVE|nr:hypothetical protein AVEN_237892-1 [Araneus ventricosus]
MDSQSRRSTRVPLLTALHKSLLLSWDRQHYHWTVDDRKHVTWSDESRFQLYRTDARVRVLKHPVRSPTLIHVHCAFRRIGTIPAGQCETHASRVATKWLQEHSSDFRHCHWPPKSPDMNIIEDIRDALLHAVEKRSPPPRTPMDLLTALQDSWCEKPPGCLQTLVETMPRRVAVLFTCSWGLYTILDRCTSFSGSSV